MPKLIEPLRLEIFEVPRLEFFEVLALEMLPPHCLFTNDTSKLVEPRLELFAVPAAINVSRELLSSCIVSVLGRSIGMGLNLLQVSKHVSLIFDQQIIHLLH